MSTVILGSALRGLRFLFRLSIVSRFSSNISNKSSAISGSGFDAVLIDHSGIQKKQFNVHYFCTDLRVYSHNVVGIFTSINHTYSMEK